MSALLEQLAAVVGPHGLITDPAAMAPYLVEERGLYQGAARAVVRPADTAEVAAVVRLCAAGKVAIVPQAGNTGLVGGGIPFEHGGEIVLSVQRLTRIRSIDAENFTITAEAGCILADVQAAADAADRLFPLSLAAEGSCRIGGNIATNAGGVAVLRYGNTRELVLGLEVVLPDGRVWDGLRALRKDNTGYDLKQLFIGSEGTLGVITAAVLKLFPRPCERQTALVGVAGPAQAVALLARLRAASGDRVTAFELMPRVALDMVVRHIPGTVDPLAGRHPWYVLTELSSSRADGGVRAALEEGLKEALADGLADDAVLAESLDQRLALWRLRETIPEAQKPEGGSIKHDIAVPVSRVPAFLVAAGAAVEALIPGIRVVAFGHLGDGNIHFNLSQPAGADKDAYLARWHEVNRVVHDIVAGLDGSISAEHGLGRLKRDDLARYRSPVELEMMAALKRTLDPLGIMNPGKVVPAIPDPAE